MFEVLPEILLVQEVHLQVQRRGFRPKAVILVTTLLDAQRYSKAQLAEVYYNRWQAAEINLRHLKTTLQMAFITAKTPEMVRKSIWAHLLAYNVLRHLMGTAARTQYLFVWRLSLQGARQVFQAFIPGLAHNTAVALTVPIVCGGSFAIPARTSRLIGCDRIVRQRSLMGKRSSFF